MYLAPPLGEPWIEIDPDEYDDEELWDGTPLEGYARIVMPGGMAWYFGIVGESGTTSNDDDEQGDEEFWEEWGENSESLSTTE